MLVVFNMADYAQNQTDFNFMNICFWFEEMVIKVHFIFETKYLPKRAYNLQLG